VKLKLRFYPDKALRKQCKELGQIKDKHKILAAQMHWGLREWHGIGLAAPQVGRDIQLIVVNTLPEDTDGHKLTMFNPKIVEKSKDNVIGQEGCLSLPNQKYKVSRPEYVTVQYIDQDGLEQANTFYELTARCIQHEIDHLSGILALDYT